MFSQQRKLLLDVFYPSKLSTGCRCVARIYMGGGNFSVRGGGQIPNDVSIFLTNNNDITAPNNRAKQQRYNRATCIFG